MKEENRKYAKEAYEIVDYAATKIGSRLPGTQNEKKFHDYMADKLREIGISPKQEEFAVSPRASIGGIPYAGYFGIIMSVLVYFALDNTYLWFLMAFAGILFTLWLVFSVFLYKRWFDMFFHREISRNTYGELLPADGEYDYTVILSGHTDTSWNWKHSEKGYFTKNKPLKAVISTYGKVGFGAGCVFLLVGISIAMAIINGARMIPMFVDSYQQSLYGGYVFASDWAQKMFDWGHAVMQRPSFSIFYTILLVLPVITAIGSSFVAMWGDKNPENASRGAMDNATGIALSYEVIKYFKENPEKMPPRCRIIDLNVGSEEAGLRGSMAFAMEHKNDEMLKNAWNINIDSVADKDYFEVVIKDDWQGCRFDADLEKMFKETFRELEVPSKSKDHCIHNPVGGCDSTPMTRAGVKSVTFAAQNPMLTYYYHTFRDMPDRFDEDTVGTGFDVVLGVIDKIGQFQQERGYNGPQKK